MSVANRSLAVLIPFAVLALAGCESRPRYYAAAPPPPPPPYVSQRSPIVQMANSNGFRDGRADGERDLLSGAGFHPRRDQRFRLAPGYDERTGPFDLYRDQYQEAYLRGYGNGFRRAETGR